MLYSLPRVMFIIVVTHFVTGIGFAQIAAPFAMVPERLVKRHLHKRSTRIELHPFITHEHFSHSQTLSLHQLGQIDFDTTVKKLIRQQALHPLIGIRVSQAPKQYLSSPTKLGRKARRFHFHLGSVPICEFDVTAVQVMNAASPLILGDIPLVREVHAGSNAWPSLEQVIRLIETNVQQSHQSFPKVSLLEQQACYYVVKDELMAVWDMVVEVNGLPYQYVANEKYIFKSTERYFGAFGIGHAYVTNPREENIETYSIDGLTGDGTLTTDNFYTEALGRDRALDDDHDFRYPNSHPSFTEVNAFIHLQRQYQWFKDLGFEYDHPQKLLLQVHATIDDDPNNALYLPPSQLAPPSILIGDGGQPDDLDAVLINLPFDEDVVSHEFSHHVIFRNVTQTSRLSESLVLHEGLADFFTQARTGSPCLASSICPIGSPVCSVDGECLRTAENDLRLTSIDLPVDPHGRSQLISGMLWQMRQHPAVTAKHFDRIAYRAVTLLVANSGYRHLVIALLTADRELYDGRYGCILQDIAIERGMHSILEDMDCQAETLPEIELQLPIGAKTDRSSGTLIESGSPRKNNFLSCGTIQAPSRGSKIYAYLLLSLPFLYAATVSRRCAQTRTNSRTSG